MVTLFPGCCTRIAESHQTPQEPRLDAKAVRNFITSSSRDTQPNGQVERAPSDGGHLFLYRGENGKLKGIG